MPALRKVGFRKKPNQGTVELVLNSHGFRHRNRNLVTQVGRWQWLNGAALRMAFHEDWQAFLVYVLGEDSD